MALSVADLSPSKLCNFGHSVTIHGYKCVETSIERWSV
jgi:hypothetical protein